MSRTSRWSATQHAPHARWKPPVIQTRDHGPEREIARLLLCSTALVALTPLSPVVQLRKLLSRAGVTREATPDVRHISYRLAVTCLVEHRGTRHD
jgi:hypothetical protein